MNIKKSIKFTPLSLFIIILLGFFIATTTSCHRKGCTDPKANNYDSKSKKDDESCTYDYEYFVRSYTMLEDCNGTFTYSLVISQQEDADYVLLENLGGWVNEVNIPALVDGKTLSFDAITNGIRFVGNGSIDISTSLNESIYKLTLNYKSYDSDGEQITSCTSESQ